MTSGSTSGANSTPRGVLPVLFIGVFMAALDTAVIGPVFPILRETFGVDNRAVGLVMSIFVLFSLCSTALLANLGDHHGRRPIFLASVACFAFGSLAVAASPSFSVMIASRALQGIGAGGITPAASAFVGDLFAPEARGRALGLIGATYGMAFVLGPPLAGVLMVALNWRWIFIVNLPIAALVLILGRSTLPRQPRKAGLRPPLDVPGVIVMFALLSAFMLGVTRIADAYAGVVLWPWFLAAAAVLLALLIGVERRAVQPLIPLSLFANRRLATTYVLTIGSGFGMGSIVFLSSIATSAYGVSAKHAGFVLLPLVVCSMLGSMLSGRSLNRIGPRGLILFGFAMLALGYGASSVTGHGLGLFLAATMPVGIGIGVLVGGAMRSIAIDEAPIEARGAAQGLINICTAIGTLVAAAAIGAAADLAGSGAAGFEQAYRGVAALMLLMLAVAASLGAGA